MRRSPGRPGDRLPTRRTLNATASATARVRSNSGMGLVDAASAGRVVDFVAFDTRGTALEDDPAGSSPLHTSTPSAVSIPQREPRQRLRSRINFQRLHAGGDRRTAPMGQDFPVPGG